MTCTGIPAVPPLLPTGIQPCCAGPASDKCGIDAAILGFGCVETNQPGNPDDTCFAPDGGAGAGGSGGQGATDSGATDSGSTDAGDSGGGRGGAAGVGGTGGFGGGFGRLPGCCKPNGTCGLMINLPGVLELGCVEFTANDSGPPQRCTPSGN